MLARRDGRSLSPDSSSCDGNFLASSRPPSSRSSVRCLRFEANSRSWRGPAGIPAASKVVRARSSLVAHGTRGPGRVPWLGRCALSCRALEKRRGGHLVTPLPSQNTDRTARQTYEHVRGCDCALKDRHHGLFVAIERPIDPAVTVNDRTDQVDPATPAAARVGRDRSPASCPHACRNEHRGPRRSAIDTGRA